jgi:hypothetical protein
MARKYVEVSPDVGDSYEVSSYYDLPTGAGSATIRCGAVTITLRSLSYSLLRQLGRDLIYAAEALKPPQAEPPTLAEEAAFAAALDEDFDLDEESPTLDLPAVPLAETPPGWKDLEDVAREIQAGTYHPDPRD